MKTFATVAALGAGSASALNVRELESSFLRFAANLGKSFRTSEEFNLRKSLFAKTDAFIKEVNSRAGSLYKAGHNMFSDMT